MKRRKVMSFVCILLGVLFIGTAILLFEYNEYESDHSEKEKDIVLNELQEMIAEKAKERTQDGAEPQGIPEANEEQGPDETGEPTGAGKRVMVKGYDYIGYLSLPSLEEEFPIMAGWDERRLKIAPCRYFGSPDTKDLVIAGHNYRHGFSKIKKLQENDTLVFTDAEGNEYYYVVDAIEILDPEDVSDMIESPWELSLYTCTYEGRQRYTVRCKQVYLEDSHAAAW